MAGQVRALVTAEEKNLMATRMIAIVEAKECDRWLLAHNLQTDCNYGEEMVPRNIAPESWGKFNFAVYYEKSGEKDFPEDISLELKKFIENQWPEANRPSWMSLREIKQFYEEDSACRYAHLDIEQFLEFADFSDEEIRVIFWADQ